MTVNDGFAPVTAGQDVPGRDPAADAVGLQGGDDGIGRGLVLAGIADKDLMGHVRFLMRVYAGASEDDS